jgi:hypothetical protein
VAGADAADNDITGRHGNSQPKPKPPTDSSSRELSADTTSRITIAAPKARSAASGYSTTVGPSCKPTTAEAKYRSRGFRDVHRQRMTWDL